jgi:NAD(P)-dependent dehydrogenase (short-subunit alcohol dehydrogenase family)
MPSLIVFGARNLGRAIARHLAGDGWQIAAVARSADSLERLAAEVPEALPIAADARIEAEVEAAFEEARARLGHLDLIVVAISPSTGTRSFGGGGIAEADAEAFAPYLGDLLPGLINCLRVGTRVLKEQAAGTFVQITGGSARRGMAGRGPWAAAAFATRGLVQAAASELREVGVHVALLVVDATIESEKTRGRVAGQPAENTAAEEDVAQAVAYLASQSPRAWTHELTLTPRGDRWVP